MLARQAAIVRRAAHRKVRLGPDHDIVALREVANRAAQDLLRLAERVHVGDVEEVDALLERALDEWTALLFGEDPGAPCRVAVSHDAETDARNLDAGASEIDVLHRAILSRASIARSSVDS